MPKLNDTQAILLSAASQREDGSLFPLPTKYANTGPRVTKAITGLQDAGLIEERDTSDRPSAHRIDGDIGYGLYITKAGLAAIGVGEDPAGEGEEQVPAPGGATTPPATRITKTSLVLELLRGEGGATLAELIAATGWLPHTTRAALTGLRKKGYAIARSKREGETCYRITGAAA